MSFYTFNGYKCIANDMYKSIMGLGLSLVHSLSSFIIPAERSTLVARLSLFSLRSMTKSRLSLDHSFGPRRRRFRVKPPSPSSLGARLSLFRFAQSRIVGFRSMPGFHPPSIRTISQPCICKPTKPYVLQSCKKDMYHTKAL